MTVAEITSVVDMIIDGRKIMNVGVSRDAGTYSVFASLLNSDGVGKRTVDIFRTENADMAVKVRNHYATQR